MLLEFVIGKLIDAKLPFHNYLKDKELILGKVFEQWTLLGIYNDEGGFKKLCKWVWENDKPSCEGYEKLEDFIKEVNLGNDGFGFDLDEIEIIESRKYDLMKKEFQEG